MDYPNIQTYLGENWVEIQKKVIEGKSWIRKDVDKYLILRIEHAMFKKIDRLIDQFKACPRFIEWVTEVQTNDKNFEDLLLELFCLEEITRNSDKFIFRLENIENKSVTEGYVSKFGLEFYIEVSNIRKLKGSPIKKAQHLFEKSKKKFKGNKGLHFVGCSSQIEHDANLNEYYERNFVELMKEVQKRLEDPKRRNENLLGVIFLNMVVTINPEKEITIHKKYTLFPNTKKGMTMGSLKRLINQ